MIQRKENDECDRVRILMNVLQSEENDVWYRAINCGWALEMTSSRPHALPHDHRSNSAVAATAFNVQRHWPHEWSQGWTWVYSGTVFVFIFLSLFIYFIYLFYFCSFIYLLFSCNRYITLVENCGRKYFFSPNKWNRIAFVRYSYVSKLSLSGLCVQLCPNWCEEIHSTYLFWKRQVRG